MADPFSILVGTAGLADVCIRFAKAVKQAKDGFEKVDEDLDALGQEIAGLHAVNDLVERSYLTGIHSEESANEQKVLENHWLATSTTLAGCRHVVEQIEALILEILSTGVNGSSIGVKRDKLRRYLKQQSREKDFARLRSKLAAHQLALQTSLAAIGVIHICRSQASSEKHVSDLSGSIGSLGSELQIKIALLEKQIALSADCTLDRAVQSAREVAPLASLNRHFYTPQSVSSIFTGRLNDLRSLSQNLVDPSQMRQGSSQRRFVVYGLPGSGKTQFCCKFALENQHRFWGVFWVDAASEENAEQSFSLIASIGKVAPNLRAVKNWLSTLDAERSWLLIIDNADETTTPVENYFPDGDAGTIIITTRNPMLKVHGTIGPRFYHFEGLGETEAVDLLLKAALVPLPWTHSTIDSAKRICQVLGCLPLALLHAGKTILGRLCTLETYLDFFQKNWNRIRKLKNITEEVSTFDASAAIYSSYELIHDVLVNQKSQASDDALELLKIFSFLHCQKIRIDIFMKAASNPTLELAQQRRRASENGRHTSNAQKLTWQQTLRTFGVNAYSFLWRLGDRPVLPQLMRSELKSGVFDDLRLRCALQQLFRMSLVIATSESDNDSYSVHPAVHLWVRERPEMTIAEQAVVCGMTANILSRAILLPPLGDKEEDEIFRRDLLVHVSHVHSKERELQDKFLANQLDRARFWPVLQCRLDAARAVQLVKFSLVYAQGDRLKEAEELQRCVANFALTNLGIENTKTMDILLLLSSTYWRLAKGEEAAKVQKQVLEACIEFCGEKDVRTFKVMDAYGSTRWLQGHVIAALNLHRTAVDGLRRLLGDDHVDVLRAMGNLGRAVGKDFKFTEAIKIHSKVYAGLCNKLSVSHLDTITAKDNLAMAYYDRAAYGYGHTGDLDNAMRLELEVFSARVLKLGREHLYTLWAGLNLARIKAAKGDVEEALSVFLAGHKIALRNLGETHFGVLLGKVHHGRILMCAHRYREAKTILTDVVSAYGMPRKGHPDRLLAVFSLIKCRNLLEEDEAQTAILMKELTENTIALFGPEHASARYLLDPKNLSIQPHEIPNRENALVGISRAESFPIERPFLDGRIEIYGHI